MTLYCFITVQQALSSGCFHWKSEKKKKKNSRPQDIGERVFRRNKGSWGEIGNAFWNIIKLNVQLCLPTWMPSMFGSQIKYVSKKQSAPFFHLLAKYSLWLINLACLLVMQFKFWGLHCYLKMSMWFHFLQTAFRNIANTPIVKKVISTMISASLNIER